MEVSFVVHTIRRFWWLIVACAFLGVVAGYTQLPSSDAEYESHALLMLAPTGSATIESTGSADRYVASQLQILTSESLASTVAGNLGDDTSPVELQRKVVVVQNPASGVVTLSITTTSAERAQLLVDTYVRVYFDRLQSLASVAQARIVDGLTSLEESLTQQLQEVDAQVAAVMAPYLHPTADPGLAGYPPIPTVEQVAPELASRKLTLLTQLTDVRATATRVEITEPNRVQSEVLQQATLPSEQVPAKGRSTILGAAGVAGILLGFVVAALWARLSSTVLDGTDVKELLDEYPVGSLPAEVSYVDPHYGGTQQVSVAASGVIDLVSVLAESGGTPGQLLSVLVVGARRPTDVTSLAVALANRFSDSGVDVLLMDADSRAAALSSRFAHMTVGLSTFLAGPGARPPATDVPGVRVVALLTRPDADALRQYTAAEILTGASSQAAVLVIDGGPLLESAATVQLGRAVDAVVLAMPSKGQPKDDLVSISRVLRDRRGLLLPVLLDLPENRDAGTA